MNRPCRSVKERPLAVLRRLNEARYIGQRDAAVELSAVLDELDLANGYDKALGVHFDEPVPHVYVKRHAQRNPNWRAALDKLNAMRGRS